MKDYQSKDAFLQQKGLYEYNDKQKEVCEEITYFPEPGVLSEENDYNIDPGGILAGSELTEPIYNENGDIVWDISRYSFLNGKDFVKSIHPNLLRQEQRNNISGLLPVVSIKDKEDKDKRIYQLLGYGLSTMSFVESKNGWIIIDPLDGKENAIKALEVFKKYVMGEDEQIVAIIISHSHVDHYKGVDGVLKSEGLVEMKLADEQDEETGKIENILFKEGEVAIIAPNGFYEEAISENLYLGNSMERRATYMYGARLIMEGDIYISEKGHIGSGLGKTASRSGGTLPQATLELKMENGQKERTLVIDGITVSFQDAPGTEAPSEFHIFFPEYETLCPGENVCHTMHNLLTSRGAKVRNPKAFAEAIDYVIEMHGNQIKYIIGTHHWPVLGREKCLEVLEKQRDMYRFFNDQVIRKANMGMNSDEIAEGFTLPESLGNYYYNKGYYGTLNHNAKAVYQYYVGWWDGNPATYFRLPDKQLAELYVGMIGADKIVSKAEMLVNEYKYREAIEILKHVVFSDPTNEKARYLQADAMEQLGYSFESGTWRNIFLAGALDLRKGVPAETTKKENKKNYIRKKAEDMKSLTPQYIFEFLSTLIKAEDIELLNSKYEITTFFETYIGFLYTDTDKKEYYHIDLKNCVLHYKQLDKDEIKETIPVFTISDFADYYRDISISLLDEDEDAKDPANDLERFFTYLDAFDTAWNIVFPLSSAKNL